MLTLLLQAAGSNPPPDWVGSLLASLGTGAVTAAILYRILDSREKRHAVEIDAKDARIADLTDRLFTLAESSTKVAHAAQEVVKEETDPVAHQLARIERRLELLQDDGGEHR